MTDIMTDWEPEPHDLRYFHAPPVRTADGPAIGMPTPHAALPPRIFGIDDWVTHAALGSGRVVRVVDARPHWPCVITVEFHRRGWVQVHANDPLLKPVREPAPLRRQEPASPRKPQATKKPRRSPIAIQRDREEQQRRQQWASTRARRR